MNATVGNTCFIAGRILNLTLSIDSSIVSVVQGYDKPYKTDQESGARLQQDQTLLADTTSAIINAS